MSSLLRRATRTLLGPLAPLIPLAVYQRLSPRTLTGFFYHMISDQPVPHVQHLYPVKSSADFEHDIRWLKANTTLVGYDDLLAHAGGQRALPENAAFISFDDGFRECYDVVRPILLHYDVPCIFFLTTDWIDNRAFFFRSTISLLLDAFHQRPAEERHRLLQQFAATFNISPDENAWTRWLKDHKEADAGDLPEICRILNVDPQRFLREQQPYLTRSQILEMQREGFVFGAHTCNHTKMLHLSPEDQCAQILESVRIVADLTGKTQVPFAFPFSGEGVDRTMLQGLQEAHPEIGLIFDTKKLRLEPGIFHRIWADQPVPGVPAHENLSFWLHDAYRRQITQNNG